eukprot:TRINITY_DN3655_c0_g1_i1.p1 TRINITY_DN3655_c0_g1~~TRINITY_DN3655_c0_g1_i1.p1  ORF type:complete len:409 (+),score=165.63 TRINITY_DN3655_c0_g1_i1:155-1228(+)
MVEFAGWSMPIQYEGEGILASHFHSRKHSSLFDVSHMAQLRFTGKDRLDFLESLVVGDIKGLAENTATLSLLTNEKGGIIDDTIITNRGDHIFMVVNAGCADKDIAHLRNQLSKYSGDVKLERIDRSLVALQGPTSEQVLSKIIGEDLSKLPFMSCKVGKVKGLPDILISRCGYTGEDGFEISVAHEGAVDFAKLLLKDPEVHAAGLGSRDSLRLEAGLCLYGHDIDENTTPIEASLLWTIGKRRREEKNFLGANVIIPQIKGGVERKRIGLIVNGPPAREGTTIHDPKSDEEIGKITSGTHSPVLAKSIAMGYVKTPFSKLGTEVNVKVRGKTYPAAISKMPFVPTTYKRIEITPV